MICLFKHGLTQYLFTLPATSSRSPRIYTCRRRRAIIVAIIVISRRPSRRRHLSSSYPVCAAAHRAVAVVVVVVVVVRHHRRRHRRCNPPPVVLSPSSSLSYPVARRAVAIIRFESAGNSTTPSLAAEHGMGTIPLVGIIQRIKTNGLPRLFSMGPL